MANISPDAQAVIDRAGPGAWEYIQGKGYAGKKLTSGEATRALAGFTAGSTPTNTPSNIPTLEQLAGQTFQFDPTKYLPDIQKNADLIYTPQQANIDALKAIQTSQTEKARITTHEDFAKRLNAEIEAINNRGAFFGGGGAVAANGTGTRVNDILNKETGAMTDLTLQDQAAQAGLLAQKAGLNAAQAEYIQSKLTGAENSAYSQFTDQRDFLLGLTKEQRQIFENDRKFNEDVRQFGLNYALDAKAAKAKNKNTESKGTISQFTANGKVYTINNATGEIKTTGLINPKKSSGDGVDINNL